MEKGTNVATPKHPRMTLPIGVTHGAGLRVAVVVSRFNQDVTSRLRDGAIEALLRSGVKEADIVEVWVPGAWEIPLACQSLNEADGYDAIVALGCVIRGETSHHLYVAGEAARGIADESMASGVPIGFGLLTTDTHEQAMERAGGSHGNKGADAALAALEMVGVLRTYCPAFDPDL